MTSNGDRWLSHTAAVRRDAGVRASPGRAAVAEVLGLLHEHGLLRRIDAGEGIARYEPADPSGDDAHHHVRFANGRIEPFTDAELTGAMSGLGARLGLEIDAHELIVYARQGARRAGA